MRSKITTSGAQVEAVFASDKAPALTRRQVGQGTAWYCAFLPGLSYFKPALPLRPADRSTTDAALAHFIPTAFDEQASQLIARPAEGVARPVVCSERLVESTVIESKHGVLIPLINWSKGPVKGLTVTLSLDAKVGQVTLASGKAVQWGRSAGKPTLTLDLDVADAIVLKP
jgi:hypothetical protein